MCQEIIMKYSKLLIGLTCNKAPLACKAYRSVYSDKPGLCRCARMNEYCMLVDLILFGVELGGKRVRGEMLASSPSGRGTVSPDVAEWALWG